MFAAPWQVAVLVRPRHYLVLLGARPGSPSSHFRIGIRRRQTRYLRAYDHEQLSRETGEETKETEVVLMCRRLLKSASLVRHLRLG